MPVIPKKNPSQTVWIAKWEHKHGEDLAIHTTEEGARKQLVAWARGCLEEWQDDFYKDTSDEDLLNNWVEISGETEFLSVEDHILYGPEVWDKVWEKTIKDVDPFDHSLVDSVD